MTTLSAIQRGALGLATTDSPTFNGLSIDTTAGVDGQWNTSGLTVYANSVTPQHDAPLHVMSGSAGAWSPRTLADELVVENSADAGISVGCPDASSGYLMFSTPSTSGSWGAMQEWHYTNGTYKMTTNKVGAKLLFGVEGNSDRGEWNTTGLTVYANGVTPQHDGPLHVMSGSAGTVTAGNSYDELVVEGSGNTGMSILAPDASQVGFSFGSPTNKTGAELNWTYNSLAYNIATNVANATINFYPDNYGHRGQWNTTGLTCFASGVTPQHDGVLHVMGGSAGTFTAATSQLVLESSSVVRFSLASPDASNSVIDFCSPSTDGSFGARLNWVYNSSTFTVGTNKSGASLILQSGAGTTALTLNSSQQMVAATTYSTTVGATNRDLYIDNTGLIGYVSSLQAAKKNIQQITDTSWLHSLNPVSFKYRKKNEAGQYTNETDGDIQYGMIAEEVEAVRPDLCFYDDVADLDENGEKTETTHKELRGIQYSKLVPVLLKEVQKLRAELNQMKAN